jgi:hypothetical protein
MSLLGCMATMEAWAMELLDNATYQVGAVELVLWEAILCRHVVQLAQQEMVEVDLC